MQYRKTFLSGARFGVLLFFILLMSGVLQAQDVPFISLYSVGTEDGNVSMFLPVGWTFIDDLAAHSAVAFGETEEAAQAYAENLTRSISDQVVIGGGGTIQFFKREDLDLTADSTNADFMPMIDEFIKELEADEYTIYRKPETVSLRSGDGAFAIVTNPDETAFLAYMFYGDLVGYISAGSPPDQFQSLGPQIVSIIESVQVPGEDMLPVPELTQAVSTGGGAFSMRVPDGWSYGRVVNSFASEALAFGSNADAFLELSNRNTGSSFHNLAIPGIGGFARIVTAEALEKYNLTAEGYSSGMESQLNAMPGSWSEPWTIPGIEGKGILYFGYEKADNLFKDDSFDGTVQGLMLIGDDLLHVSIWAHPSHDFRHSVDLMRAIMTSITFPDKEDAQLASSGDLARITPTPFDMSAQTPDDNGTVPYVSNGNQISLRLPEGWFVRDFIDTDFNVLGFGSTEKAAVDRQEIGSGEEMGGIVRIINYDPLTLPPYPTNTQAFTYLKTWAEERGAVLTKDPTAIVVNGKRIVYAVYQLDESEWGYVALHDFGARFVFSLVTAATKEQLDENSALLGAIVDSIAMPAQVP